MDIQFLLFQVKYDENLQQILYLKIIMENGLSQRICSLLEQLAELKILSLL